MIDHHTDGMAMARVLIQYMDSPAKIQREIMANYDTAPHIGTISSMMERRNRRIRNSRRDHDATVILMDALYEQEMSAANDRFLSALLGAG